MSQIVPPSFDPFATHPFTNNSGLLPKPAAPSQYPHAIPSSSVKTSSTAQGPIILATTPLHAPQPKRAAPAKTGPAGGPKPIFVPFRPERSSPELADSRLKKKLADAFQGKATWGIDQVVPPLANSARQGKAQ